MTKAGLLIAAVNCQNRMSQERKESSKIQDQITKALLCCAISEGTLITRVTTVATVLNAPIFNDSKRLTWAWKHG